MKSKSLLTLLLVCTLACSQLRAQEGTSCENAIHLTLDYTEQINVANKEVWYTANTFDLPLAVYFIPNDWSRGEQANKPIVEMDFTCTPGVYEDSILCSLFCKNSATAIMFEMPYKPQLKEETLETGAKCYALKMGTECRDLLFQAGVTQNMPVFIKVRYPGPGFMSMAPDNAFASCMDDGEWLRMGKTYHITPSDKDTFFVAPFTHWQNDSVQFSWSGEKPMTIFFGGTCDFDPDDGYDENILDYSDIEAGGTFKYRSSEIKGYIERYEKATEAGLFYAKIRSESEGDLKVERIPAAPTENGAKLLKYNTPVPVGDEPQVTYAISASWTSATRFLSPTALDITMHVCYHANFADTLASYTFSPCAEGHELCFKDTEMESLWDKAPSNYIYLRFECASHSMLKAEYWDLSSCAEKSIYIPYNGSTSFANFGGDQVYRRLKLNDWLGGTLTISTTATTSNPIGVYIGGSCNFDSAVRNDGKNPNSEDVIYKQIAKGYDAVISGEELSSWEELADEENNIYVRFSRKNGSSTPIKFTGTRHENTPQLDPEPEKGLATLAIHCDADGHYIVTSSYRQEITLYGPNTLPVGSSWIQGKDEEHMLPADLTPGTYTLRGGRDEIKIEIR